ncbi:MAG: sulfatase-like hydrolase/transferase [Myxococcota bacterium]
MGSNDGLWRRVLQWIAIGLAAGIWSCGAGETGDATSSAPPEHRASNSLRGQSTIGSGVSHSEQGGERRGRDRPDIVLILIDDVGTEQLGAYGSLAGNTPNIDAIARDGLVLTRSYGTPKCHPSRAELMTGTYPFRMGFVAGARRSQDLLGYPRIPAILREAGYHTAVVGKWHLSPPRETVDFDAFGFDDFNAWRRVDRSGALNDKYWNARIETPGGEERLGAAYAPDVLNERARAILRRERDRPLFLYYPLLLAHGPLHSPRAQGPGPRAQGTASRRARSGRTAEALL